MHEFYSKIELNQPIDTVFKFFNSPKNLEQLMPPFMGFSLLTPGELVMQQGAVFDYMVTVFGLPNRWTTYISEYNPPYSFSDIQLKGPNSYWHHVHRFESTGKTTTIVTDHIHYLLPFGLIGKIGNAIVMKPIIKKLFNHRTNVIEKTFGSVKHL